MLHQKKRKKSGGGIEGGFGLASEGDAVKGEATLYGEPELRWCGFRINGRQGEEKK